MIIYSGHKNVSRQYSVAEPSKCFCFRILLLVLFLSLPYGRIEEEYKTIKCAIVEESFTGKTPHAIYQEFHASLILSNLQVIINRKKSTG